MKSKVYGSVGAFVFLGVFFAGNTSIAQPSLPPASVVTNEPSRLSSADKSNTNPGKNLPEGNSIVIEVENKSKTAQVKTKPKESSSFSKAVTGPCAEGAITCIEIGSLADKSQAQVPVTFGQPFQMGHWKPRETGLVAKDHRGNKVPLQFDQISSHQDGSARFAVLSAQISDLGPQEKRIVNIFGGPKTAAVPRLARNNLPSHRLEATIYHPQRTLVLFGNRVGHTPGIAFAEGEKITLVLSGPVNESYSLVLNAEQAGGSHTTLTRIAEAFMQLVNSQSKYFVVDKPGGGYESLWVSTQDPGAGAFQVRVEYQGPAKFQTVNEKTFAPPEKWIAQGNAGDTKGSATALPDTGLRLQGPVVSEIAQLLAFRHAATGVEHPHLVARLDSRLYHESGAVWTDFILENNWTFKKDPENIRYALSIQENEKVIYQQPVFDHYHHARWHKALWSGTAPAVEVRHHMPYFMASGAVWNYDLGLNIPEKVLDAEAALLKKKQAEQQALGPMKNVMVQTAFPGTGGRSEIAPLPRWTALYLVTQDPRAYASMVANTDATAAVSVHYRDEKTDLPVEPLEYPDLSVYGKGNIPSTIDRTVWYPDTAHQGSFSYVPYLLTGQRFYLDEMLFWASWNIFSFPADYRSKEKALVHRQQVRGQAWVLRSLAEADRSLPDSHPLKASFKKILKNNLEWYKSYYIDEGKGSPLGFVAHSQTEMSTWQNDFMVTVLALMAENNEPLARQLHAWFSRFSVGRFLADEEGFCAARASGYYWKVASDAGKPFTLWSEIFKKNYPDDAGKPCDSLVVTGGYPDSPGGYAAYARGMLGASANAGSGGSANAARAYVKWKALTPRLDAAFEQNPSWAIVPRK